MGDKGNSSRRLVDKLGIREGFRMRTFFAPPNYRDLIEPLPAGLRILGRGTRLDLIHLFAKTSSVLCRELPRIRPMIHQAGMIWVSWPKQTAQTVSDLDGNLVRSTGIACGLVDVKVCSVDETWSALKFVVPLRDRKTEHHT